MGITLVFSSPITPDSTERQALPASYLEVVVTGSVDVSVYVDLNGRECSYPPLITATTFCCLVSGESCANHPVSLGYPRTRCRNPMGSPQRREDSQLGNP